MNARSRLPFISLYSISIVTRGVAGFLLPLYFVSVGIPDLQVGISIGLYGVSLLVFEIMWGVLFDRIGPRRLIIAFAVISTVTYLFVPFIKNAEGAVTAEFLLGASGPILAVVSRSLVIRQNESGSWAGGFGLLGALFALTQFVGALIGSITAPVVGVGRIFFIDAGVMVVVCSVYLLRTRATAAGDDIGYIGVDPAKNEPRPPLNWRGLPLISLVAVPTYIGYAFFVNIVQLVVTQTPSIGATELQAGIVVSSFWIANVIFQPLLSSRGGRNARVVIAIALFSSFGVFALLTQLHNVWEIAFAALLEGVCYSAISPLSLSLLMVGVPKRYAGRAMGIYGAAEDVGVIIGPLLATGVWVEFGLSSAYLAMGATFLLVLVPFAITLRRQSA